jgi:hypothetical protein
MQIIIIQNTDYHFEVTVSLYSTLKHMGYDVLLYVCKKVAKKNKYMQQEFIEAYSIKTVYIQDIYPENSIGLVVSAYPYCNRIDVVPNIEDDIFSILRTNNLFFICHRLKKQNDNNKANQNIAITTNNSICLTPLASSIGIDYIWLTDCPVQSEYNTVLQFPRLTIQGDFVFRHRDPVFINQLMVTPLNKAIHWKIIGNKSKEFVTTYLRDSNHCNTYENISQKELYYLLATETDFIVPCMDEHTRNGDYVLERYSTSFLYAYTLKKPIFAHEVFEKVYNIPGIYYNDNNVLSKFEELLNINYFKYQQLINSFYYIKDPLIKHNEIVIHKKLKKTSSE